MFDQSLPHWIKMNIVNHGLQDARARYITDVPAAGLPEMVFDFLSLLNADPGEKFWSLSLKKLNGLATDRFLDLFEEFGVVIYTVRWMDDQVNMIGHEDIRPEGIAEFPTRVFELFGQPLTAPLLREKWKAMITGEG